MAAVIWPAQGQRCARRSRSRRPPRASRPATEKRRRRSRLGSQRRAVPVRAGSCVQARSSLARAAVSHHSWFGAKPFSGGRLRSPGVLRAADPLLAPGPPAVAEFQVRELAAPRVGGEGSESVPVNAGEPQLRARVRPFLADIDPHPGRPGGKVHQAGDPRAVTDLPVAVIGRVHADAGTFPIADCTSSVLVIPAE